MIAKAVIGSSPGMLPIKGSCPEFEIRDQFGSAVRGVCFRETGELKTRIKIRINEIVEGVDSVWGYLGMQLPRVQVVFDGEVCNDEGKPTGMKVHAWCGGLGGHGEAILTDPEGEKPLVWIILHS